MNVLITGGTGFIGKKTVRELKGYGDEVRLFRGDVCRLVDWEKNLKGGEVVVHLAGVRTEGKKDFEVNTRGAENLFKAAQKLRKFPKKVILASSQAVYIGLKPSFKEEMKTRPITTYGQSKLEAEKIAKYYGQKLKIKVVILRYSTVLGEGIREKSGMSGPLYQWVKRALSGKEIKVFQDGKQRRDYVHVDDVVRANILAVKKDIEGIFNVGGGKIISLLSLAKLIKKLARSKSEIVITGTYDKNDPQELFSNIGKLKKLGWRPKKTAREAVEEFVKKFEA